MSVPVSFRIISSSKAISFAGEADNPIKSGNQTVQMKMRLELLVPGV